MASDKSAGNSRPEKGINGKRVAKRRDSPIGELSFLF